MSDKLEELAARVEALDGLPARIRSKLEIDEQTGCWNWCSPNSLVGRGRGYVSVEGKSMLHHRAVESAVSSRGCSNAKGAGDGD